MSKSKKVVKALVPENAIKLTGTIRQREPKCYKGKGVHYVSVIFNGHFEGTVVGPKGNLVPYKMERGIRMQTVHDSFTAAVLAIDELKKLRLKLVEVYVSEKVSDDYVNYLMHSIKPVDFEHYANAELLDPRGIL